MKGDQIQSSLQTLTLRDRERSLFGASYHKYELYPCLEEYAVRDFETRHGINLPKAYRSFLLEIGNGGAGPGYGLFPLEHHDDGRSFCTFAEGDLVGTISAEFQHRTAWNLDDWFWAQEPSDIGMSERELNDAMAAWDEMLDTRYWSPSIMDGAIPISHRGCGLRDWLVVTGDERGHIWHDNRVNREGIAPAHTAGRDRLHFEQWYDNWLNARLMQALN